MICAISGEEVKDPIVSPKSGAVFERKYIEHFVSTNGTDPINNETLTIDELIPLRVQASFASNSAQPSNTFIPNILSTLQSEYNAMVAEISTLRKNLESLQQELSVSLYRQDAAINVATRAIKERDEAREALEKLTTSVKTKINIDENGEKADQMEEDDGVHNISDIHPARDELFKSHKALKVKSPYKLDKLSVVQDRVISKVFGVNVDFVLFYSHVKILIGAHKNEVLQYDVKSETLNVWKSGLKTIGQIVYNNNGILAAVTGTKISFSTGDTFTMKRKVLSINTHPSLNLFVITSAGNWYVSNTKEIIATHPTDSDLIKGGIHGDGEIFAAYNGEKIKLMSLVSGDELAAYDIENKHVQQISFAANGYWLLVLSTSDNSNTIQVFDLRKNLEVNKLEIQKDRRVDKFIIDPSSSLIVVETDSNYLSYSYLKKTKSWSEIESLDLAASNNEKLFLYSNGEDVVNDGDVKFVHYNPDADNLIVEKLAEEEAI